ncbi:MAG: hypothetical protein PHR39_08275, partial [Actinomycetota bacterium]|nr:hypothetical protein [Actinomycetota bacterium]
MPNIEDMNANNKIFKKFFTLVERGQDVENYLDKFPNQRKELEEYADIIGSFNGLKNISADSEFENEALKEVYLRARVESLKNGKKIPKKDVVLLNLRPAYLKPLMIFIG